MPKYDLLVHIAQLISRVNNYSKTSEILDTLCDYNNLLSSFLQRALPGVVIQISYANPPASFSNFFAFDLDFQPVPNSDPHFTANPVTNLFFLCNFKILKKEQVQSFGANNPPSFVQPE